MENIFYELETAKTGWKVVDSEVYIDLINQVLENVVTFFVDSFKFFEVALYNEKITSKNADKYTERLKYFIKEFGKRFSGNKNQKTQSLLQYISKTVDFDCLFPNLPKILKIDEDEKLMFVATASSLKENLLKEEKRIANELKGEDPEEEEVKEIPEEEEKEEIVEEKMEEKALDQVSEANIKEIAPVGKIVEVYRKK